MVPGVIRKADDVVDGVRAANRRIALGLDGGLDTFAGQLGAESWKQFAKGDPLRWRSTFLREVGDPTNQVLFNLDGVDVWDGVTRGAAGRGGATDWELATIYNNPHWWDRIKWYKDGKEVANPFQ
jgi:hypothetical protein